VDQLHRIGVRGIEFCGGGEPTLNPHLAEAIDRIGDLGIHYGLLTNGTYVGEDLRNRLVAGAMYCRISIESASEETFNDYKKPMDPGAEFSGITANVRELVQKRNKRKQETKLQISLKYAIDRNNSQDVGPAIALGETLGVDSVQFKLIRNVSSEIKNHAQIRELIRRIHEAQMSTNSRMRVICDLTKSRLQEPCWLSPLQTTIDPFGDVYICCYFRHRKDAHRLGNIFQKDINDIWYSSHHWEKIKGIKIDDCNKYDCRFHYYNRLMKRLVIEDIGQLHFV
jgi:radical SAM protein with 4Fe4S-binding SPASM domain